MPPDALLEAVPNFSEGRRADVVHAVAGAAGSVAGVWTLDLSSDADHHRSVLTLAGPPAPLRQGLLLLFEAALAAIDLRRHRGAHPRMGAVDVVPLIPLEGTTIAECAEEARRLGEEVARRFDLPVYLYEAAASSPERRNLAEVRRGEFEGLEEKMRRPEWRPDFGPAHPHPTAGAVAIGARPALIAFNVYLKSQDLKLAKRIARTIREAGGGMPAVKALGLPILDRGLVQVSINLTDFERTPPLAAFERIRNLAGEAGVEVLESELVGLVPAAALPPDPGRCLLLAGFDPSQILENRLERARRSPPAGGRADAAD
jgi:glutamate formiminotransferase